MPQAQITINAVAGSDTDLPINTLVQLNNNNIGGELTFNWTTLDEPPGPADPLSSTVIQNPTFTPKKEGTYLLRLIVNLGMATEQIDIVTAAVRDLKTRERVAAAGETTESDPADGWAADLNSLWRRVLRMISDNVSELVAEAAAALTQGDVVYVSGVATIKATLPGEEIVLRMDKANATIASEIDGIIGVVETDVDGNPGVSLGELMRVRLVGLYSQSIAGAPAQGDPVYVSDAGLLSLTPGTITRQVGEVAFVSGGFFRVAINGGFPPPLATVAPVDVDGTPASVGVSGFAARGDHKHDVVVAAPLDVGVANAAGAGPALAFSNHVHRGQLRQAINLLVFLDLTTTSLVFVSLASIPIVVTAGNVIKVLITWSASCSAGVNDIDFRVLLDGAGVALKGSSQRITTAGTRQGGAILVTLSASVGAHTIDLEWRTTGGTAQIRSITKPDTEHLTMRVEERSL